jgi:hypothetical protein
MVVGSSESCWHSTKKGIVLFKKMVFNKKCYPTFFLPKKGIVLFKKHVTQQIFFAKKGIVLFKKMVFNQTKMLPNNFFLKKHQKMEQSILFLHLHFLMLWSTNGIKYHANPLPVSCPSGTPMSSAQGEQEHGCRGCGHP